MGVSAATSNRYGKKSLSMVDADLERFGYKRIGTYVNTHTPLTVQVIRCGHVINNSVHHVMEGRGCTICSKVVSAGESIVRAYFEHFTGKSFQRKNIVKVTERSKPLQLDGYCKEFEYNGQQHYSVSYRDKSDSDFAKRVEHDKLKSDWCKQNEINLIIIKYDVAFDIIGRFVFGQLNDEVIINHNIPDVQEILQLKKIPMDFTEEIIKQRGGTLLPGQTYIRATLKVSVRCKNNHIFKITPDKLKQGKWCAYCAKNAVLTPNDVDERIKSRSIELIDETFENSKSIVSWRCTICSNIWMTSVSSVVNGSGCPSCSRKKVSDSLKLTISEVDNSIKDRNIKRLSADYVNARTKMEWMCLLCNNIWWTTTDRIRRGRGCPDCAYKNRQYIGGFK